jgi:hypothetical protein
MKDPYARAEKALLVIAVLAALACMCLMLGGCSEARKMERKRAKAEALVKEAIETYPDIMRVKVQHDTIVMWTDPVAGAGERSYSQASMDSLATICADLLSVYQDQAEEARQRYYTLQRQRMRTNLCRFDTVTVDDGALSMLIWAGPDGIRYVYNVAPERVDTVVQSSVRTITTEPEREPDGRVRSWSWVWVLLGIAVSVFILLFMRGSHRFKP